MFKRCVYALSLTFVLLSACVAPHPFQLRDTTNAVYSKVIASPSLRQIRRTECEKIAGKSIADDTSSEAAMEKSTMAEEQLLLRQQDCQYLNDFYAELHFAAVQNLLAASAWQSCLHDAPVDDVSNASGVGTYIECLRVARTASACLPSAQGYDSTRSRDAACRQFVAALKWQATGADWNAGPPVILPGPSNRNDSLFDSEEAVGNRPRTVILPAAVTLRGVTRTGFFVNCCSFGWEYRFPFSYIRLNQTILLSAPDLGSEAAEEIELDTVVPESMLDKAVIVTCGRLDFGMTGHYAEGAYCWHTSVQAGRTAAKNSDPAAITGSG